MGDAVSGEREPLRARELIKLGGFGLTSEREGDMHSICLFGELDLATADAVEKELLRVEATDADAIVIDLSGLTFIDSTGVRLLLYAAMRSRADSDRLALLRGGAAVQRVFELTALEDKLPFAD
jgi:anti-sigma B factor antagonist